MSVPRFRPSLSAGNSAEMVLFAGGRDLTGYQARIQVRRPDGSILTVDGFAPDAASLTTGHLKFAFGPTSLQSGYNQRAELDLVLPGGGVLSYPFILDVEGSLT